MKRLFYLGVACGALLVLSCQQKPAEQPRTEQPAQQVEQKPAEQAQTTTGTMDMQAFAQQKGCFACHDINVRKVGPAFREVAVKSAGKPDAEVHIAERIKKGGVGEWGNVPMPPQNLTEEEAKQLARWVLSLK